MAGMALRGSEWLMVAESPWLTALLISILVATVPMTWVLRIMRDLPEPLVVSYRRWPAWANSVLIAAVTGCIAAFIRFAYYGPSREPLGIGFQLVIAGIVYVFGMVLLIRQFAGLYPEYLVTTGWTGLGIRKAVYSNIVDVQTVGTSRGETRLRIELGSGEFLPLELPTTHLFHLYEVIENSKPQP
jgi:hypothetical protein